MATLRAMNVLFVHGIGWGNYGKTYARRLEIAIDEAFEREFRRLRLRSIPAREASAKRALRCEAVYWAPITQRPEDALLRLLRFGRWWPLRKLDLMFFIRRQMVGLLGDVITYEGGPDNPVYRAIHTRVGDCAHQLSQASADEREPADSGVGDYAPLTLIGHSLGSVIASDFVWDNTRGAPEPHLLTPYRLALKNMITLGSPLALYALRGRPLAEQEELANSLDSPVRVDPDGGLWANLFDKHDPIAFPLEPIRAYRAAGVIDCTIKSGTWLTSWNIASHTGYWRSAEAADLIGRKLALDWAALNDKTFAATRYAKAIESYRRNLARR